MKPRRLQRPTISSMRPSLDAFADISRQKMEIGICGSRSETLVASEAVWLIRELPWTGITPFLSAMEEPQVADKAPPTPDEPKAPRELKGLQRVAMSILGVFVRMWTRSLRLHFGADVQAFLDKPAEPVIMVLWHNRLLLGPELFRRYLPERKKAGLISASSDGAWLAAFFEQLGITPIRGSRHGRGVQAFRELIKVSRAGYDVGITPDGSRGPMYDMKAGAATLALRGGAPILLLSYNYTHAWRLKSWDRFYLPLPFSRINVRVDDVGYGKNLAGGDAKQAAVILKERLMAITEDDEYFAS